jgi:hypothetical protein
MTMCIPIACCLFHSFAHFFPTFKALAGKSQRTKGFPPEFNQVQISCTLGLKDAFPARMRSCEEERIGSFMHPQIVEDGIHLFHLGIYPGIDLFQVIYPVF